ncbi:type I restriction enzyme R subunit [Catenulispora sp. EB89]|uniref:type I restriction endonuclease subunit R n=1 Tax=Catenulispora sp. EB89 TaxID=3156257 RepID=UPI0035152B3A
MTEEELEDTAADWFDDLGWTVLQRSEAAAERSGDGDVLLQSRLRAAVAKLNPAAPPGAADAVIAALTRSRTQSLVDENRWLHDALVHGLVVDVSNPRTGEMEPHTVLLADFEDPDDNDFVVVRQLVVAESTDPSLTRRPDLTAYINGIPVGIIELKKPGLADARRKAWKQIQTYRERIPQLLRFVDLCVVSDGHDTLMGTQFSALNRWAPWKSITDGRPEEGKPSLEVLVRGVFAPERICSLLRDFVVFLHGPDGMEKRIARYHQFHAVRAAHRSVRVAVADRTRQGGVVWHTQGSGKSMEILFCAGLFRRDPRLANPAVVVVTDRVDLETQLFEEYFAASRDLLPEETRRIESRADLRTALAAAMGGTYCTTVQKFATTPQERDAGRAHPELSDRSNVIVIVDEAHRTQYGLLDGFAANLRSALPNATFLAFTGTPVADGDRDTRAVFGPDVAQYDMQQARSDGAIVPIYYEAHLIPLNMNGDPADIDDRFDELTEGADEVWRRNMVVRLTDLERIVTSPPRVEAVVKNIVEHWTARSAALIGKGMIVCWTRQHCLAVYEELIRQRPEWFQDGDADDDQRGMVKVVISGAASDGPEMNRHVRSAKQLTMLKARMADPNDPLELVIVCDMWLTGFDAPPLHTMYVDRRLRGVNLLQAIARVNRTFRDKPGGLIVDHVGIGPALENAIREHTQGERGSVKTDTAAQETALSELHDDLLAMLHGCPWQDHLASGAPGARLGAVAETVDFILSGGAGQENRTDFRSRFRSKVRDARKAFSAVPVSDTAARLRDDLAFFNDVAEQLTALERREAAVPEPVESALKQMVDRAVHPLDPIDLYRAAGLDRLDISAITEHFANAVANSPYPALGAEVGAADLARAISRMARIQPARAVKFSDKLQDALERYANRLITAAQHARVLVEIAEALRAEQNRGQELDLTPDQLIAYDLLVGFASSEIPPKDTADVARKVIDEVRTLENDLQGGTPRAVLRFRSRIEVLLITIVDTARMPEAVQAICDQTERGFDPNA